MLKAKEVHNRQKELEIGLLGEEAKIKAAPFTKDIDPLKCALLENKEKIIHDCYV
jgi:hypothetical protein